MLSLHIFCVEEFHQKSESTQHLKNQISERANVALVIIYATVLAYINYEFHYIVIIGRIRYE